MERRERRSDDKETALGLFLESQMGKLDVRGLAVTNERGALLAGAGVIPRAIDASEIATWRLRAAGEWLVIASFGGRLSYDVGSGVRRIVSA